MWDESVRTGRDDEQSRRSPEALSRDRMVKSGRGGWVSSTAKRGHPSEWPADLRVREFLPKRRGFAAVSLRFTMYVI